MTQATLKFTGATKNPVKRKASPAQLAARQKFADMVRARAAAAKGKKMPRKTAVKKNPMEGALLHLSGTKYGQVKQQGHIYTAYVLQKVNTGIGEEMDLLDSKSFKTKSGAANWLAKNYGRKTNPRKKTVSQKISQLEHEGYPHKQSIAIALSEQRKGKVKRNPRVAKPQKVYKVSIMQEGLHKNWMGLANFFTFAEAENYSHYLAKQHKNWSIRVHDTRAMK